MINQLVVGGVGFGKHAIGVVLRPYETYRRITSRATTAELVYIIFLLAGYFAAMSVVKVAAFHPLLMTQKFVVISAAVAGGYMLSLGVFWVAGRFLGGAGRFSSLALAWGYTLLPTLLWFLATSVLYVLLTPPRTTSSAGVAFSIVYLVFSTMMLAWKLTLGYLTLRFGLKLDLPRILVVGAAAMFAWSLYSVWMYRLGIFRIPFL